MTDIYQKWRNPDTDKLKIQVLPFETDDENERYKVIMECINDFMGNLNISISGIGTKMLENMALSEVFDNGGKKDSAIN